MMWINDIFGGALLKVAGKIIKWTLIAFIIAVNALLVLRVCMHDDKSLFNGLYVDDTLRTAWTGDAENFAKTHSIADIISEDGVMYAYNLVYVESAARLQVTVRVNDRVLRDLYGGNASVSFEDAFSFALTGTDMKIEPTVVKYGHKFMYSYVMLIFDGVIFPPTMEPVTSENGADISRKWQIAIYAAADKSSPYETLPVHYADQPWKVYPISGSLQKSLEK